MRDCLEPNEFSSRFLISLRFVSILYSHPRHVVLPTPCMHLFSPSTYHVYRAPHSSWFEYVLERNKDHWALHMQFPPVPCYILPLTSKYLPRHPLPNIFSLICLFFSARDEFLSPHKTTHKIVFLNLLVYYGIANQKTRSSGSGGSRFSASLLCC